MSSDRTTLYTDGACSGNPGPGGWAWVIPDGRYANGAAAETTNQRMELTAVLEAVRSLEGPLHIISDSTYVVNCFKDNWWTGWLKRGWKNSAKKPVANRDLWEPLIELFQQRDVTFEWVKGHCGNEWNERADQLAVEARDNQRPTRAESAEHNEPASAAGAAASEAAAAGGAAEAAGSEMGIAISGVRPTDLGGYAPNEIHKTVRAKLVEILEAKAQLAKLADQKIMLYTGLGLGAETLAAEAAIAAKVGFVAVLAFPDPSEKWPKESQQHFDSLIDQALDVVLVNKKVPTDPAGFAKAFQSRERWYKQNCSEAILVHNPTSAQSRKTVQSYEKNFGDNLWVIEI